MATVKQVLGIMRTLAPEEYEYKNEYDNIGLMLGSENAEVKKILCCLDVTSAVVDEAISVGANFIISHHPVIWYPIKNITDKTVQGRILLKSAQNNINIYSAHTNLDFASGGINDFVANLIGLKNITCMEEYGQNDAGFGRVGDLADEVSCIKLKEKIAKALDDNYVRIVGEKQNNVKRIAVINGGSGGDTKYIDMAINIGADCLITADVKHHVALYAKENNITLIEPQHFSMEYIYIAQLTKVLQEKAKEACAGFEVLQALTERNPRF